MPDEPEPERSRRLDVAALTVLVCGLLVADSVLGRPLVLPPHGTPAAPVLPNLLGEPGDRLAGALIESLGAAVYFLLAGWFVLAVALWLRRGWLCWSQRLLGWLVLLPCAAVAADRVGPDWLPGPVTGSGGAVGAFLVFWLDDHFYPVGQYMILGACAILGLLLAADRPFLRLLRGVRAVLRGTLRGIFRAFAGLFRAVGWCLLRLWRTFRWLGRVVTWPAEDESEPAPATRPRPIPRKPEPVAAVPDEGPGAAPIPITRSDPNLEVPPTWAGYELPSLSLLDDPEPFPQTKHDEHLREVAALLEKTFNDFGLNVRVVGIHTGPVVTQYEISLEIGLRVAKVTALADDLALNLKVPSVRIVAPIPGKNTVGIEVPNEHRAVVRLKELIAAAGPKVAKCKLPLFLGKDTEGRPLVYDLAEMPHLLIAGRTGTGKSVCLNSIILSLLLTRRPDLCRMLMLDPKKVELAEYARLPHLMHPVVTDDKKAEAILAWAVDKMEERYELLRRARVRNIASYNELSFDEILRRVHPDEDERSRVPARMPYIVIVVDEVGDLMMSMKKEVEGHIIRLAQKSRAAGIHLILTTQKPTVDVITGLIKSNLPARICFQVTSRTDSRVVLDEMGAEKLLGKGDMLFLQPGAGTILRAQGSYCGDEEITRVVAKLECDEPAYDSELMNLETKKEGKGASAEGLSERDPLYAEAIEIVIREGRGSVSLLQRALGIGYGRAARLIDFMAEDGIVGHYNGAQAREVLLTPEEWSQRKNGGLAESA